MKTIHLSICFFLFVGLTYPGLAQTSDTLDLFPLDLGMHYTYSYQWRYSHFSVPSGTSNLHRDSGLVEYVVIDSLRASDSLRIWSVRQTEHLFHHLRDSSTWPTPTVWDTVYWSDSSYVFSLSEDLRGRHEVQCTSRIWRFPISSNFGTDRVFRFDSVPSYFIYQHTPPPGYEPYWSDYWYFDTPRGLYRQVYSESTMPHNSGWRKDITVMLLGIPTGVAPPNAQPLPTEFVLLGNYPNPFNSSTIIVYELPVSSEPVLTVYDVLGRMIARCDLGRQPAGHHSVPFTVFSLPTGVYFYRLTVGEFTHMKKMVVMK